MISLNKTIFIDDMRNLMLILTFFSLWLSTKLNLVGQDFLAYTFILSFGVLHGSNDINILSRIPLKSDKKKLLVIKYVLVVLLILVVFLLSKLTALLFFILLSGYHFGEQHLKDKFAGPRYIAASFFLLYGLCILFMIFHLKSEEVISILNDLAGILFDESFFKITLYGLLTVLSIFFVFNFLKGFLKLNFVKEAFLFAVFFVVFKTASLLWAFSIYFIIWHSLPSLYDQMNFLYGNASKTSIIKYLKSSLPYWMLSLAGLGILYLLIGDSTEYFITCILYVLAAITFPHVLVMSQIEKFKNLPEN